MKKELMDILYPLYEKMGIRTVAEKMELTRGIDRYLQRDREHFVELEEPEDSPFFSTPERGFVCNLVPLAHATRYRKGGLHRVEETICLVVTNLDPPCLVHSTAEVHMQEKGEAQSFRFPVYRLFPADGQVEGMKPDQPQEIRPIATDLDGKVYCMLFYAFERVTRKLSELYVPHKTERAMFILNHIGPKTVIIENEKVSGKLLPIAIQWDAAVTREPKREVRVREEAMLFVTETDARYVMKKKTQIRNISAAPFGSDPDGYIPEDEAENFDTYRYIALEDIDTNLSAHYN